MREILNFNMWKIVWKPSSSLQSYENSSKVGKWFKKHIKRQDLSMWLAAMAMVVHMGILMMVAYEVDKKVSQIW